jgi:hypothetical protein
VFRVWCWFSSGVLDVVVVLRANIEVAVHNNNGMRWPFTGPLACLYKLLSPLHHGMIRP